mmetsp:Transcript_1023/g.2592  ORF Transcript_1023/g.2592 Transcript_1023/m.2592 type:complete len:191 (-) Transcript_1023:448-1020(-)
MSAYLCGVTGDACGGCVYGDEDLNTHDSLRDYAVRHLGATADYVPIEGSQVRVLKRDEFDTWFHHALTRQGWPVYKYGRGKRVARCLRVDDGELSWGSKKDDSKGARRAIKLTDIDEVVREPAPDAPEGTNPDAMICFIIKDGTGLKVLCTSVTDATLLTYGFKRIIAAYRRDAPPSPLFADDNPRDVAQ